MRAGGCGRSGSPSSSVRAVLLASSALLVVGTFSAAAGLAAARRRGRAAGQGRGAGRCTSRSCRSGAICARRSTRRCWPRSSTRRAAGTRGRAERGRGAGHRAVHPRHLGDPRRGRRTATASRTSGTREDAIPSAASYDCELARVREERAGRQHGQHAGRLQRGRVRGDQGRRGAAVPRDAELREDHPHPGEELRRAGRARWRRRSRRPAAIYYAQQQLGTPYLWGGNGTAAQGGRFDCSGLTQAAYRSVGIELPRVANDQWNAGPHPTRDELLPGRPGVLRLRPDDPRSIHHVGIYVGGGYMINAPHTGAVIRFDPIDTPDYIGATRVTEDGARRCRRRRLSGSAGRTAPRGAGWAAARAAGNLTDAP